MTPGPHAPAASAAAAPAGRLVGVDLARSIALLGMIATHVVPLVSDDGAPAPLALVFSGVSSVLFVLLSGVGLALRTGGPAGPDPARLPVLRRRIARRAGLLFLLGLLTGMLDVSVAVILCVYGVLFLMALPFLGLRARPLLLLGGAWSVLGPLLVYGWTSAQIARLGVDGFLEEGRLWTNPVPGSLASPGVFAADLLLTGYYPALAWAGFVLLGLGLGRAGLDRPETARRLLVVGGLAYAAMTVVGVVQRHSSGVVTTVAAALGEEPEDVPALLATLPYDVAALAPDPLWLVLVAPHGGSPLEAVRALGWACAVLGLALTAGRHAGPAVLRLLAPLAGAGRATLTLYVTHLLVLAGFRAADAELSGAPALALHWLLCLAVGLALQASGARGPFEAAVTRLSRLGEPSPAVTAARR